MNQGIDWDEVNKLCIGMMIIIFLCAIFASFRAWTFNVISERITKKLRYDLFYFLVNKEVGFYDENKTGDMLSRISSDSEVVGNGLSTNISMLVRSVFFIISTLVILFLISWKLTIVTLAGIAFIVLGAIWYMKKLSFLAKTIQDKKAIIGNVCEESMSNIRTVKAFSTEDFEFKKLVKANDGAYQAGKTTAIYNGFFIFFI
jgi:ABC-type multidrug transport system fused ATPase/permease subunit